MTTRFGPLRRVALALFCTLLTATGPALAQEGVARVVEIHFTPVRRSQIAVWIERADGTYLQTIALTQATAVRGIGNRPGAAQMNSGYKWPYGRREGVLPIWGHRRAAAPGAEPFQRVIFQDRTSEGWASRSANDFSRDEYYCLSFTQSIPGRDNLDAMTCPSVFNSDKGRYLTEADIADGYAEPFQTAPGAAEMRPFLLDLARVADTRVSVHPNAGLPNAFGGYDETPETTAHHLTEWAKAGLVNIVGGCCGTTPEHISTVVTYIRGLAPRALPEKAPRLRLSGLEAFELAR